MSFCGERSVVKSGYDGTEIATLLCKRWSCPVCEPRNAARLRADIKAGHPTKFVTLTCRPPGDRTPEEQARWMKERTRRLFELWRRKHPRAVVEWLAVVEAHKSGWPHIHVAARAPFLVKEELSALWRELTGSYVVRIMKVRRQRGFARYLAKYLTKGSQVDAWGKRHWRSRGYLFGQDADPPADRIRRYGAEIVDGSAPTIAAFYVRLGWREDEARGETFVRMVPP